MKTKLLATSLIVCIIFSTSVFGQKLSKEEVISKITKSWNAVEVGDSLENMSPKKNKEILVINSDNSFSLEEESKMMGEVMKHKMDGVWSYNDKEHVLNLTLTIGDRTETVSLKIEVLTDDQLVLSNSQKTTSYKPIY